MKTFCIAGPIIPEDHYFLPHRLNWQQIDFFISSKFYFVLHAPRQSGKTTAIEEYIRHINSTQKYYALYVNIETAQTARDNVPMALIAIVELIARNISFNFKEQHHIEEKLYKMIRQPVTINLLFDALTTWAELADKPTILFIDKIDSLIGDSLLSVLRQIRAGFSQRPKRFPQALCLIGLRDVRDYRVWSKSRMSLYQQAVLLL